MRLSEIYTSIQGEGPNVGQPTVFVRFGGCNLRCPGWGTGTLPDGTTVPGCDTVYAVYPEFRTQWEEIGPRELISRIPNDVSRVCITGGEPLIQRAYEMEDFVRSLMELSYSIDLFTNGSRLLPDWVTHSRVTVVMDIKLMGSGEGGSWTHVLDENLEKLSYKDAIKFVIKDRDDFNEAVLIMNQYNYTCQVYFGPVWGTIAASRLSNWILEAGLEDAKLNIQTHKYIFGDVRGV